MRAIPARPHPGGKPPGPEAPIDPREDDAADKKEEHRAGEQVVHDSIEFPFTRNIGWPLRITRDTCRRPHVTG